METYRSNATRRWALTLLYTAVAPLALSTFAGEGTSHFGKAFLKSYVGVCMEVKFNKELRDFSESVFFGLSLRQFVFSVIAVGVAVGLYFLLRNIVNQGEIGWMCILGAMPFGMAGFFKYQGMPLERFAAAWMRTQFIYPRRLHYIGQNLLIQAIREIGKVK